MGECSHWGNRGRLRDLARFGGKKSYRLFNKGPGVYIFQNTILQEALTLCLGTSQPGPLYQHGQIYREIIAHKSYARSQKNTRSFGKTKPNHTQPLSNLQTNVCTLCCSIWIRKILSYVFSIIIHLSSHEDCTKKNDTSQLNILTYDSSLFHPMVLG